MDLLPKKNIIYMKKLLFFFSLTVVYAIIFFVIGEICFRVFRGPPNPLASTVQTSPDYLFEPNTVSENNTSKFDEFVYSARINNYGYRGKDFQMPKVDGLIRIFVIGDSFTYGVGANDDETIPFLIEEKTRARNIRAEVINAGLGGTSPISHFINLENIHLKYNPDLIFLLFDLTDLWDDWYWEKHAIYDQQGNIEKFDTAIIDGKRDWIIMAGRYSAFARYFQTKILPSFKKMKLIGFKQYISLALQGKRAKAVIIKNENIKSEELIDYDGMLMMRGREKKEIIDQHWTRTAKYLNKINERLKEQGIPFIIVIYPHAMYVGKDQWTKGREAWGFEVGKLYKDYYPFEIVEAYSKNANIPFINTLDAFLKTPGKDGYRDKKYFFDWDGHLTPEGNKVVAEAIVFNDEFNRILLQLGANELNDQ